MSTIVTRQGKGSPLLFSEVDQNFTNLNNDKTENANAAITGGSINGASIGGTTASSGKFTTLQATDHVTLEGITSTGATGTGNLVFSASPTFTGTVSGITSTMVGLGNVTNESKATMFTNPTFTGHPTIEGVTSTGATGTGKIVFDTSPTFSSDVTITGNLTVNGTTTTINSTTITVDDKNIELGSISSPTDITANGGGLTLKGDTDKTFNWVSSSSSWTSSENVDVASGKVYKINTSTVLSNSALVALSSTFALANTTATTLNIGGEATTISIGASTGTLTINNSGLVHNSTSYTKVAAGTSSQRPGSPSNGMIRYNSEISSFEGYASGAWSSLGGVKSVDGLTYILAETSAGASNDELEFYAATGSLTTTKVGGWNQSRLLVNTSLSMSGTASIGTLNLTNALGVSYGGTGATTATGGLTNLLPTGESSGYVLTTSGRGSYFWAAAGGGSGNVGTKIDTTRTTYTATAGQTIFTGTGTYVPGAGQLRVYVNGIRQYSDAYTETSTTSFTLSTGVTEGAVVLAEVDGFVSYPIAASDVSNSPAGNIAATTVQAAINELDSEKSPLAGSASLTTLGTVTTGTWNASTVGILYGGTGATTASGGLTNLLPTGEVSGYVLTTSGRGSYYWAAASGGSGSVGTKIDTTRTSYTATSNQTLFTGTGTYTPGAGQLRVYIDGVRQFPDAYTETSSTSFTLSNGVATGTKVLAEVDGFVSYPIAASDISNSPAGNIAATTVQAALNELDSEKAPLASPSFTGTATVVGFKETVFAISGTTPAISPANGTIQTWTLSASSTPTAGTWNSGETITLMIDDGTNYTINWTSTTFGTGGIKWVGGSAPTLATTGYTVVTLWKVSTQVYGAYVGAV